MPHLLFKWHDLPWANSFFLISLGFAKFFEMWNESRPCSVKNAYQFSSVSQSCPTLCDPMNRNCQASLSITNSQSLLKLMPIESLMPSSHLILCCPLLLLPSIFASIKVFLMSRLFPSGGQSQLQHQSFQWTPISLRSKGLSRAFSNTTVQKHQFFGAQLSSQSNSNIHTWPLEKPQPWPDRPLLEK